jgi:hypothetical protein
MPTCLGHGAQIAGQTLFWTLNKTDIPSWCGWALSKLLKALKEQRWGSPVSGSPCIPQYAVFIFSSLQIKCFQPLQKKKKKKKKKEQRLTSSKK